MNVIQDVLPNGFSFSGLNNYYGDGSSSGSTNTSSSLKLSDRGSAEAVKWKYANITVSKSMLSSGAQQAVFHFSAPTSTGSNNIKYDESRDKLYLEPGEGLYFYYCCYVDEYAETEDVATNAVAMPYDDYTGMSEYIASKV